MSTAMPRVTVNINNGNRPYQIVATLLLCGAVGMISFALAENGWLEVASTTITIFMVQLATTLVRNGLVVLPGRGEKSASFSQTRGALRTAYAEFQAWQASSPIWRLAALAAAYTATFMLLRWLMGLALHVFSNVWVAGAAAAFLASLIIFPSLIGDAITHMRNRATPPVRTVQVETEDEPARVGSENKE